MPGSCKNQTLLILIFSIFIVLPCIDKILSHSNCKKKSNHNSHRRPPKKYKLIPRTIKRNGGGKVILDLKLFSFLMKTNLNRIYNHKKKQRYSCLAASLHPHIDKVIWIANKHLHNYNLQNNPHYQVITIMMMINVIIIWFIWRT